MMYSPDYSSTEYTKNPKANDLKKFRTYSYHHVIMVTSTTGFVDELSLIKGYGTDVYLHSNTKGLGEDLFDVQYLNNDKSLPYVVVANTMTDSNLIFPVVNLQTFVAGNPFTPTENSNQYTPAMVGNTLTMSVIEPFGTRFVEFLMASCNSLGIHHMEAIYILKTIFVGHTETGQVEVLTDYAPYPFTILDINFSFSHAGTNYEIRALPLVNGVASSPEVATTGGKTFSVEGTALADFVDAYNRILEEEYQKTSESLKKNNSNVKPSRFRIELDDVYKEKTTYDLMNGLASQKFSVGKTWICTPDASHSLIDTLYRFCSLCEKIQEEGKPESFPDGVATVYIPSIYSRVVQVKKGGSLVRENVFYIKRVERKILKKPKPKPEQQTAGPTTKGTEDQNFDLFLHEQLNAGNLLEYDFIFSGKNNDVLEFNMNFNNFGAGILYNTNVTKQPVSNKEQTGTTGTTGNNAIPHGPNESGSAGILTSIPYHQTQPMKDPSSYIQFQTMLRSYTRIQALSAEMEVVGNPRLFTAVVGSNNGGDFVRTSPFFVKVNVYMPKVDPATGFVDFKNGNYSSEGMEKGFRNPFWLDGIFWIYQIQNTFSNGKFTQRLSLLQVPSTGSVVDSFPLAQDDKAAGEQGSVEGRSGNAVQAVTSEQRNNTTSKCRTRSHYTVPDGSDGGTGSNNVKAFLKTIRVCEGTYPSEFGSLDDNGYRRIVNGYTVPNDPTYAKYHKYNVEAEASRVIKKSGSDTRRYFRDMYESPYYGHPRYYVTLKDHTTISVGRVVPYETPTSAAGAYQFVYDTWSSLARSLSMRDMSKNNQDRAAVELIRQKGVLDLIKNGKIRDSLSSLQFVWASLGPRYGQGYICPDNIEEIFVANGGILNTNA